MMPPTTRSRLLTDEKRKPHDMQATIAHPRKPAARGRNLKMKKPKPRPAGETNKLPKAKAAPVAKKAIPSSAMRVARREPRLGNRKYITIRTRPMNAKTIPLKKKNRLRKREAFGNTTSGSSYSGGSNGLLTLVFVPCAK